MGTAFQAEGPAHAKADRETAGQRQEQVRDGGSRREGQTFITWASKLGDAGDPAVSQPRPVR